jgi:hypothetical protein
VKVSHFRSMDRGPLTCLVNPKVVDGLSFDLVLGRDWFAYYQEYLLSEGLLLSNGPVDHDDCDDGSNKITGVSSHFFCLFSFMIFQC